jgi:hypothetical protein
VAGAPTFPALMLNIRVALQPFWRGPTPPQCTVPDFSWRDVRFGYLLCLFPSKNLK